MASQGERHAEITERVGSLDLLRLVSALAVVAFHYLFRGAHGGAPLLDAAYPAAGAVAIFGYLGLNLFFLISGFVIAWSAEGRSFTGFAIARFSRLYPGFVACMSITFLVLAFADDPRLPASAAQYAANLAMVAPAFGQPFMDGVYWTIVLELVFYFWVSVAILTRVFSNARLLVLALWLAVSIVNEYWLGSGVLRMVLITEYAPFFAGGMLAHYLLSRGRSMEAVLLCAAAFLMALSHMKGMQGWMLSHYGIALTDRQLLTGGLVVHLLFWFAVAVRSLIPATPLVMMLGGLTYPLYLLHQNIGYVLINMLAPHAGHALAAVAALLIVTALAWAVWRHVETPGRRAVSALLHGAVRLADRLPFFGAALRRN
ncbi:acyltransferase family protein [Zhengella sp. ZM62]|uniref:acyltransferase family protein n=1 Tax=Zhengella sedimenti TaxID=3390035 RepID=UPI0039759BBA